MKSDLKGRLRNTYLPHKKGLMPVYEAVINSIESIEELHQITHRPLNEFQIRIVIDHRIQTAIERDLAQSTPIESFQVIDDGIGFTSENWNSFITLDSDKKIKKGCRGIGRLMWLKAFDSVTVDSNYVEDKLAQRRTFTFDANTEVTETLANTNKIQSNSTTVTLKGFKELYAQATYKTLDGIAKGLLEHCLWYFIRHQGVPIITLEDDEETIDLFKLFEDHMHTSASHESITIKESVFDITHVKVRTTQNLPHSLCYCASGRLVKSEKLADKIPGLYRAISDSEGQFNYMAYLTSDFLDKSVTNERLDFNISEKSEGIFSNKDVSYVDIRKGLLPLIKTFLGASLEAVLDEGKKRVNRFVSEKRPKYRPLMKHMAPEKLLVDPSISDEDLDLLLHRETFEVEESILREGHSLINDVSQYDEYETRLSTYLEKVSDLKQSDLANYVAHRRYVLDLLNFAIKKQSDGKFVREETIHRLIVPMQITSSDIQYRHQNLWLIDERLAFHHFLASDKPLSSNPTTSSTSGKKPDIAALKIFDNPLFFGNQEPHASITVIEIKRPMRNGFAAGGGEETDPILQALGYLRRLRDGASTINGRPIPNADSIPGFIYVLADFSEKLLDCCRLHQLQKTVDGMGFFGYQRDEAYNAYIQVISFDGLIASANERNRAFFDKLGLP